MRYFFFLLGFLAAFVFLIATDATPAGMHREWKRCSAEQKLYVSDSAFYLVRPECEKWRVKQ